jgi:hypothetical protein
VLQTPCTGGPPCLEHSTSIHQAHEPPAWPSWSARIDRTGHGEAPLSAHPSCGSAAGCMDARARNERSGGGGGADADAGPRGFQDARRGRAPPDAEGR